MYFFTRCNNPMNSCRYWGIGEQDARAEKALGDQIGSPVSSDEMSMLDGMVLKSFRSETNSASVGRSEETDLANPIASRAYGRSTRDAID
jgi:hypothetical protein